MSDDLVKRLTIKAGVMEMGEKIAWGSDTSLMREAADRIEELEAKLEKVKAAFLINMMDALPNYTHAMFDKDYAKMMGETDA
jgi:hypothetical protein